MRKKVTVISAKVPPEFGRWLKEVQRKVYEKTGKIESMREIMRIMSTSKVNVRKKDEKNEIGLGF